MIKVQNLTKKYKTAPGNSLEDVNFEVTDGEFASVVGRSGAGKSTLVKVLIAEEKPTEGIVKVKNWEVNCIKRRHVPKFRRDVGVVFQDFQLLKNRNAFENVAFAMEVCGYKTKEIKERVPQVLSLVDLKDQMYNFPVELSGGEKQRVALARAMIHEPEVLIADEPTGNLDSINAWEIMKLLLKINELGTTVLLVTHNKDIVDSIQKRVITLDSGKLIRNQKKGKYVL